MPDTPFVLQNDALASHLFGDTSLIPQSVSARLPTNSSYFCQSLNRRIQHQKTDTAGPRGWMHPTENFPLSGPNVSNIARFPATRAAQANAVPYAAPCADLPEQSHWGEQDGVHGIISRTARGIVLMATGDAVGLCSTATTTFDAEMGRAVAGLLRAACMAASRSRTALSSERWGEIGGMHGWVVLHRFGVDLTVALGTESEGISTKVQFRNAHVADEVGVALFAQCDAWDVEFGEGDDA